MPVDVDVLVRQTRAGYVVRTLRFAAWMLDNDVLLFTVAEAVADVDWTVPPVLCPLCEEAACLPHCPLSGIRP